MVIQVVVHSDEWMLLCSVVYRLALEVAAVERCEPVPPPRTTASEAGAHPAPAAASI